MTEKSESQKRNKLAKGRKYNLRKKLREGKIPVLRKPLAGAEEIYLEHGVIPKVDVYVPTTENKNQDLKNRSRFKYDRRKRPVDKGGPTLATIAHAKFKKNLQHIK